MAEAEAVGDEEPIGEAPSLIDGLVKKKVGMDDDDLAFLVEAKVEKVKKGDKIRAEIEARKAKKAADECEFLAQFKSPGGVEKFKESAPSISTDTLKSLAPKLTAKERFDLLGRTAMINACGEGDHVLVQQLLDAGAPVNAVQSCLTAALC